MGRSSVPCAIDCDVGSLLGSPIQSCARSIHVMHSDNMPLHSNETLWKPSVEFAAFEPLIFSIMGKRRELWRAMAMSCRISLCPAHASCTGTHEVVQQFHPAGGIPTNVFLVVAQGIYPAGPSGTCGFCCSLYAYCACQHEACGWQMLGSSPCRG